MSRTMSRTALDATGRVGRLGDTVRGLASAVLVLGIVVGVPLALVLIVGNPVPEIPRDTLGGQMPVEFGLDVIVCVVWLAWAQLVACLVAELVAGVRGSGLPWRVPFAAAAQQDFARRLVTAVLLVASAGHGLMSAPVPGPGAARPPAAATAPVSAAPQQVATAAVEPVDATARQAGDAVRSAQRPGGAGPLRHTPAKRYVVMPPQGRHHDSLWDISERYLGSGTRYREVFELNEGRVQPDGSRLTLASLIRPGWTLIMPVDARGDGLIEVTPDPPGQEPPVQGSAGAAQAERAGRDGPAPGPAAGPHTRLPWPAAEGHHAAADQEAAPERSRQIPRAGGRHGAGGQEPAPERSPQIPRAGGRHAAGGQEPAPERSPQIPWDLVGAELLAAGLLEALVALRRRRARLRRPGSPVTLPDAEAASVEVAVRLGADQAGADYLDRALRVLARVIAEQDRQVPEVYAARLSAEALELMLAVPQERAPAPFLAESGGARWVLDRSTTLPAVDGVPAPLPGLVSVGGDGHGRVFVDLEAAGGAICVAGDLGRARSVVAAAAIELVTNRWSDDMRVTMVGFGSALAPVSEDRLRCVDSLDEVIATVTDRLSASREVLTASGVDSVLTGRVRGLPGDGLSPDFLVLASPPRPEQLAELQEWARSARRAPLGILIAGEVPSARWRFEIDDHGVLDTGVLGIPVGAQLLTARSYAALARLLRSEAAGSVADGGRPPADRAGPVADLGPAAASWGPAADGAGPVADLGPAAASWGPVADRAVPAGWGPAAAGRDAAAPHGAPDPAAVPALPRPVDPDVEPAVLVRIFGEPAVGGTDPLPPGTPLGLEIVSYLALTGGVTPRALAASVWPYGVTVAERDATLARVRDWLGGDAHGQPRLRADADGRLRLSDEVQLDWHLFVALAARGQDDDVLRALALARGPLVEPRAPRRYTWIARERVAHELPAYVVDVAHRTSASYLARRRVDGAMEAARAGLRVEPQSGQLWEDLVVAVLERDGEAGAARVLAERAAALDATGPAQQPARIPA